MQILTRIKKKCEVCDDAKYISELYNSLGVTAGSIDKTIEYVCPKCNGIGHTHVKRWVTVESLLKEKK